MSEILERISFWTGFLFRAALLVVVTGLVIVAVSWMFKPAPEEQFAEGSIEEVMTELSVRDRVTVDTCMLVQITIDDTRTDKETELTEDEKKIMIADVLLGIGETDISGPLAGGLIRTLRNCDNVSALRIEAFGQTVVDVKIAVGL